MGSGNSCMGSHPSGSRSQLSRSGTAMSKRSKLSFLICGASSGSHTHTPFQVENHLTKSTARPLEKKPPLNSVSLKPMEQPSSNCTSETGFSSSSPDSGASSEVIRGTVVKSSAEFGLINLETCSSGKCLSENDGLLPHQASAQGTPVEFHRESSETSGITFKEQSSLESEDRPSSSVVQEPANLCLVEESIPDAAKGLHSSDSDSGSASVVPDSPENCQLLQDDSAERVTSSGLGSIVSATEQDSRNRSRLHVDMVSISSDTLFRGISDVSNREARSSRGMFWDTFSRRSFRQHSDSPTIVFATSHADGLRSHDRWLLDFSDLHYDGVGHDSRHPRYGGHHRRERRRWSRYESSERVHSDLDDEDRHMSFCASGLHPNGRCTCGTFFSAEEPSIHASIFQILMLADALFEVLDEIHHHPVSDSPSVLSLPAPVDVVDSFPLKNHKKAEATENGAQCYICLAEYEEGETIRVLPCCHEYHMPCIDKWLKEIHGVCPICRGDVCEGIAEAST
ncbi:uncharacterized protein LOC115987126 [Quercus lobata]|uniref:RING-type domain-containing protein n=1 Tax=Quercus lobata TaxID=97700 RepID=A0A7N2LEM4_QUELO|nr:uncharacterized protein LOC115987126 [Quercus lobata]